MAFGRRLGAGVVACIVCGGVYVGSRCPSEACHTKAANIADPGEGIGNMVNSTNGAYTAPPSVGTGGTAVAIYPTTTAHPLTAFGTGVAYRPSTSS